MSGAFVEAIGLVAPGLPSWRDARPVLRGVTAYIPASVGTVQSDLLPANERRRAPLGVRLALRAAQDATAESTLAPATLASVFASSDADIEIIHRICFALTDTARAVSPTDFHNSVHNAASGLLEYRYHFARCIERGVSIRFQPCGRLARNAGARELRGHRCAAGALRCAPATSPLYQARRWHSLQPWHCFSRAHALRTPSRASRCVTRPTRTR